MLRRLREINPALVRRLCRWGLLSANTLGVSRLVHDWLAGRRHLDLVPYCSLCIPGQPFWGDYPSVPALPHVCCSFLHKTSQQPPPNLPTSDGHPPWSLASSPPPAPAPPSCCLPAPTWPPVSLQFAGAFSSCLSLTPCNLPSLTRPPVSLQFAGASSLWSTSVM